MALVSVKAHIKVLDRIGSYSNIDKIFGLATMQSVVTLSNIVRLEKAVSEFGYS